MFNAVSTVLATVATQTPQASKPLRKLENPVELLPVPPADYIKNAEAIRRNAGMLPGVKINTVQGPPQAVSGDIINKATGLNTIGDTLIYPDGTWMARTDGSTLVFPAETSTIANETFQGYLINEKNPSIVMGRSNKGQLFLLHPVIPPPPNGDKFLIQKLELNQFGVGQPKGE